jgi:hypothetical protein
MNLNSNDNIYFLNYKFLIWIFNFDIKKKLMSTWEFKFEYLLTITNIIDIYIYRFSHNLCHQNSSVGQFQ